MHKNITSTMWHGVRTGNRKVYARRTKTTHNLCRCGHMGCDHDGRCTARMDHDRRRRCKCRHFVPVPLPRKKIRFVAPKAPKTKGGKKEINKYLERTPPVVREMNTTLPQASSVCWVRTRVWA